MQIEEEFFFEELWKAYPIPVAVGVLAWLPFDFLRGVLFSPHGGIAWLLLLMALPWMLVRIGLLAFLSVPENRSRRQKLALSVFIGYLPITVVCAYSVVRAISPPLDGDLFAILRWFYFPLSLLSESW